MSEYPPSFKQGMLQWIYVDPCDADDEAPSVFGLDPDHPMVPQNLEALTELQKRILIVHLETLTRMLKLMLAPVLNGS